MPKKDPHLPTQQKIFSSTNSDAKQNVNFEDCDARYEFILLPDSPLAFHQHAGAFGRKLIPARLKVIAGNNHHPLLMLNLRGQRALHLTSMTCNLHLEDLAISPHSSD
jgi:hypothetical protein